MVNNKEKLLIHFADLPKELYRRRMIDAHMRIVMESDILTNNLSDLLDYLFYDLGVTIYYPGSLEAESIIEAVFRESIPSVVKTQAYKSIW